jgi:glycosyltransferase involved in cell wall biosynthesis
MKVGIYLNNSSPETGGGFTFVNTVLDIINNNLHKTHHSFIIISENISGEKWKNLDFIYLDRKKIKFSFVDKVKLFVTRALKKLTGNKDADKSSIRDMERNRINVYLASQQVEFLLYFKQNDFLIFDIPYLTTVWDLEHRLQPYFPEVSCNNAWQKREATLSLLIQRATYVVTGTETGKKQIETSYNVPAEKIIVIPIPVPVIKFNDDINEYQGILDKYKIQKEFLFYPAQYWPHKNHVTLLKSLKYLKDEYQLTMDLVCTGNDKGNKKYIENYTKNLGLEKQVKILGFVSDRELAVFYKQAFALSFLSLFGPDNLPPLEAFTLGCPVIASRIEGVEEQLGNAAVYFDPMSHVELAENIIKLHQNSELRDALIKRGFAHIEKLSNTDYLDAVIACLDKFELIRECWGKSESYKQKIIDNQIV